MIFSDLLNSPAFVIHVPELAPERGKQLNINLSNAGYTNINIFRGVNGIKQDEVEDALNIFGNPKFDIYCSKGNIGCNLSMLKVFKHIVDNKIPIATIFEDDIVFHPEWSTIAPKFYKNTPKNFDILYMGNQIEECCTINNVPRINKKSCFCMHAIVVSLKGASKLLNLVLNWNYKSNNAYKCMGWLATGITNCDIIIKNTQQLILEKKINPNTLIWYCWNGTKNQCEYNKLPLITNSSCRNTGLVFQNDNFVSLSKI